MAVGSHGDLFIAARGEHRIEMSGKSDIWPFAVLDGMRDYVTGAIDAGDASVFTELREHPFGALLLEECGRRDAADLQMLLIDPLFFTREPLQSIAQFRPV